MVVVGAIVSFWIWLRARMERHDRGHVAATALLSLLVKEASTRSPSFKAEMAGFTALLTAWEKQHVEVGNPITAAEASRRQSLTGRLEVGDQLSNAELLDLQGILQKELADAQNTNADLPVLIAIIVILGLVVVAIALASRS